MVDNRGVTPISSFNFKSGDASGMANKMSDEKMGQGGEYFAQEMQEEENAEEISEQDVSANEVPIEVSEEAPAVRDADLFRKFEERIEPKENIEEACQQMIPSDNSEE